MLPQGDQGTSFSTPQNLVPLGRDAQRSLVAATSLACIVNMWVICEFELVSVRFAPALALQCKPMNACLLVWILEPRRISSSHVV